MGTMYFVLLLLFVTEKLFESECANYGSFEVEEGKCNKEEPGVEVKSTTECLLHCGMAKCMNSMIENQTCYCTKEECASQRKQHNLHNANFFSSEYKLP